jgi:hypothetical protein
MGADFFHIAVPVTKTREEALASLQLLTDEQLISRLSYGALHLEDEEEPYFDIDENDDATLNREAVLERCVEAVNITYDVAEDRHRVASSMRIDDCLFAVAGGLSWGDSPDYFDDLCIAYELMVTFDSSKQLKWVDA